MSTQQWIGSSVQAICPMLNRNRYCRWNTRLGYVLIQMLAKALRPPVLDVSIEWYPRPPINRVPHAFGAGRLPVRIIIIIERTADYVHRRPKIYPDQSAPVLIVHDQRLHGSRKLLTYPLLFFSRLQAKHERCFI